MIAPFADPRHVAALARRAGPGHAAWPVTAWAGAAVLRRPIPGTDAFDVAGPYPLMPFDAHWDMSAGLAELRAAGAVTATFVADPVLACPDPAAFTLVRPYKRHHLVRADHTYAPSSHHRDELRRAARRCDVAEIPLAAALDDWSRLYGALVTQKGLAGGVQDLDATYAASLPALGVRAFAARAGGAIVAMALWLRHGSLAWYHLAAVDAAGRKAGAGYAVVDVAIRALLADGVACVILGGGIAEADAPGCGLDRFKAGFANAASVNLLLGAVLDHRRCASLGGDPSSAFFPSYRAPPVATGAPASGSSPPRPV